MQADYYRYLAEFQEGHLFEEACSKANAAYERASQLARSHSKYTDPIRLSLALNYSIFQYEVI